MSDAPEAAAAVERRIVSVLFADLVGFTPLAERLDSEDVATIQDAYFASVRETVQRYGGVIEKFIGDAAMAVFGAPLARDGDSERAVRAGLALIGAVEQLGARLGLDAGELQLRVGVNSGEVVHVTAGADAGRVTGDTVNTAARFQAAAGPGAALIGELTALSVADAIEIESLGQIQLKGKAEPVRAWRAIGPRPQPSRDAALGTLRAPMLGRDAELRRLLDAAERCATESRAHRLIVVAPPGVGKSRLLAEFADAVGGSVLRARVRPQATAPYDTVAQLVRGVGTDGLAAALRQSGAPEARAQVVEQEIARLLDPASAPAGSRSDLAAERDARFEAWLEAFDALLPGPSVWLIEDVHWAGRDLLAFLDRAGSGTVGSGRLVVASARPSLLETDPAWCVADRLDLAALPVTDARALVGALIGSALPETLIDAVVDRADGTPLFIEELIRTWASVGTLVQHPDGWRLAVQPEAVPLPPTVQAIYAAQLDDLPPDARLVARRGAVAGRRVPVAALEPLELSDRHDGLVALTRRGFVSGPVNDPVTGEAYAFRHALLRDAGYASLAKAERARLHLAMARWLEEVAGDRAGIVAEAVAEHVACALESRPALASGLPPREELASLAAGWYERAADAALGLSAHEAAERLLGRSIELTDPGAAPRDAARRRLRRGEVLAASADLAAGIVDMEAALAQFGHDPDGMADAAAALGRAYMQQIRFPEAERLSSETLDRLAGQAAPLRARLHALHAWAVAAQGRSDGVLAEADHAEHIARDAGDPVLELEVLEQIAAARDEVDAQSMDDWDRLERLARELGQWSQVATAARVRATWRAMDDPAGALPDLVAATEVAAAHGLREQAGWADYALCETLWVLDRLDEAEEVGTRVIEVAERYAYERLAFRTWVILLAIAAERGDCATAERYRRWSNRMQHHFPASPSPYARILGGAMKVWMARACGEAAPSPDPTLLDAIVPMVNPHYLAGVETIVDTWSSEGRADLVAEAAARSAACAADAQATALMRASAALQAAWAGGGSAAGEAAGLAAGIPAPWWERRARAAGDASG